MARKRDKKTPTENVMAVDEISEVNRDFIRRMEKRMPNLSVRKRDDWATKESLTRLTGSYFRKLPKH